MNGIFRRFFYSFIFLIFATKNLLQCLVNQTKSILKITVDQLWTVWIRFIFTSSYVTYLTSLWNSPPPASVKAPVRWDTRGAHLWTIVWSNGSPFWRVKMFLCILQIKHKPLLTSTPHTWHSHLLHLACTLLLSSYVSFVILNVWSQLRHNFTNLTLAYSPLHIYFPLIYRYVFCFSCTDLNSTSFQCIPPPLQAFFVCLVFAFIIEHNLICKHHRVLPV